MRALASALLLVLLAASFAGCAGGDGGADGDSAGDAAPGEGASTSAGAASATSAPPAAPQASEAALPFEREGETWTTVCAGSAAAGAGQCHHLAEGSPLTETLPEGDPLLRLRGELAWDGGNAEAGIGVVVERDGGWTMAAPELYAAGPSPLAFDFDLRPFQGERLGFHVASYATAGAPEAHVDVSPGQAWRLAGELTVLRAG